MDLTNSEKLLNEVSAGLHELKSDLADLKEKTKQAMDIMATEKETPDKPIQPGDVVVVNDASYGSTTWERLVVAVSINHDSYDEAYTIAIDESAGRQNLVPSHLLRRIRTHQVGGGALAHLKKLHNIRTI